MIAFCQSHDIPHQVCGKVIVANGDEESSRLEELRKRGEANGIPGLRFLSPEELREIEPHCVAERALHLPGTGITDYSLVSAKYAALIIAQGGEIRTGSQVLGIQLGPEMVEDTVHGQRHRGDDAAAYR
jgi:L-2-hydroxyglutarate oxidase LhgO